jgi:hypothetical protein
MADGCDGYIMQSPAALERAPDVVVRIIPCNIGPYEASSLRDRDSAKLKKTATLCL